MCAPDLILLFAPNLDDNVPLTGFIRETPSDTVDCDIFLDVENEPELDLELTLFVDATLIG